MGVLNRLFFPVFIREQEIFTTGYERYKFLRSLHSEFPKQDESPGNYSGTSGRNSGSRVLPD
jgi:hypothetical protein